MKKFSTFILLIVCLLLLVSCSKNSKKSSFDIKTDFLQVFFTTNYNDRYTNYEKVMTDTENPIITQDQLNDITDEYYASLAQFTTENALDQIISNRTLYNWDKAASDGNKNYVFKSANFEKSDDGTYYSYTVEVTETSTNNTASYTGQISISKEDNVEKISNFWINNQ